MQGFNMGRYVPPEFEGTISGNKLNSKHALGSRANKFSQGILAVRFEMPFPIWCTTCPKPTIIGQGVRFNAEKKKIGNYYSTPIFSFRLKHTACGGWIEIRTDPKNTAYVVHEGARKRDTGEDKVLEVDVQILTEEEREARRNNAFASLEGKVADKARMDGARERIEELQTVQDQQWEDPYALNRKLRNAFRVGRKEREHDARVTGQLQDKMSLSIDLLPANDDDARRARLIEFGPEDPEAAIAKAISRPLFASTRTQLLAESTPHPSQSKSVSKNESQSRSKSKTRTKMQQDRKPKAVQAAEKHKAALAEEIRGNTRAKIDPFLQPSITPKSKPLALGVKRKRDIRDRWGDIGVSAEKEQNSPMDRAKITTSVLVDYDSD
jgi:coiled-coil domain-containing protein 130